MIGRHSKEYFYRLHENGCMKQWFSQPSSLSALEQDHVQRWRQGVDSCAKGSVPKNQRSFMKASHVHSFFRSFIAGSEVVPLHKKNQFFLLSLKVARSSSAHERSQCSHKCEMMDFPFLIFEGLWQNVHAL